MPAAAGGDVTAPTITKPVVRFTAKATVGASSAPIRVSWTGDDDWTGVAQFQLQQSLDGGTYANVALANPMVTSVGRSIVMGKSYRYRVRARDNAGNWSAYRDTGTPFLLYVYQQTSTKFAWSGSWYSESLAGSLGGTTKYSNQNVATVRFTFFARSVAWVGMTCSYCGMAPLYVDGSYSTAINTQEGPHNWHSAPRVMWQRSWATHGTHNFELRPERTFLHPRVYVDAALLLVPVG